MSESYGDTGPDLTEVVKPDTVVRLDMGYGEILVLRRVRDESMLAIESWNAQVHDALHVQAGEEYHRYPWEAVIKLGFGSELVGLGRVIQIYASSMDSPTSPEQLVNAALISLQNT